MTTKQLHKHYLRILQRFTRRHFSHKILDSGPMIYYVWALDGDAESLGCDSDQEGLFRYKEKLIICKCGPVVPYVMWL